MIVLQQLSIKTLRVWSSSMRHDGSFMDANKSTLFRRCKKVASERDCICNPYTRGSENPSEKSAKKLVRASLLSDFAYDICTKARSKELWKHKRVNSFRIESGNKRRTLRDRCPDYIDNCVFLKKRCSFFNTVFSNDNGNWTRAPNFGASLRRPNWPCPEYPLLFYKILSKKHPTVAATRFPLSDR